MIEEKGLLKFFNEKENNYDDVGIQFYYYIKKVKKGN